MGTVSNIKVEPMSVTWGEDTAMVQTITCRADSSADLNNKYFFIYNAAGTKFHVWFDVASGGSDPDPGGSTGIEVDISSGATAGAVATAVEAAIEAATGFDSTVSDSVVTVTLSSVGYAPLAHEGVGTNFTFALTTEGDSAADIGYVDGDIEFSMPENLVDVVAHQTGTNVLSQIRTGKQVELTLSFKETSVAQMKKILRQAGGSFTPAGAGGTEVIGFGTHKDFTQTITQAKKLVLHPVVLGSGDKSRDITVHYAYPMIDSIAFSGENPLVIPVTFKAYPKLTLNDRVEYFCYGDGSQTLT